MDNNLSTRKSLFEMNRRHFLAGSAALATIGLLPAAASAKTMMALGSKKIMSLSDGNLLLPRGALDPAIPKDEFDAIMAKNSVDLSQPRKPSCNLTLLEDGDRRVLFDAGSGANFMPSAGKIFETLETAGIDPASITDVIFTHGHPDHLWGIVDDFDEIAFSEATLHFPEVEFDHWRSESLIDKVPENRKTFVIGAQNRLAAMEDQVQLFKSGTEVLPGIEAVDTKGHTAGHNSYIIRDGSQALMVTGDTMNSIEVSFAKPEWPNESDEDHAQGSATRKMLLDRLSHEKMAMIGYHLPDGGLGHVEKTGTAYRFVPEV